MFHVERENREVPRETALWALHLWQHHNVLLYLYWRHYLTAMNRHRAKMLTVTCC